MCRALCQGLNSILWSARGSISVKFLLQFPFLCEFGEFNNLIRSVFMKPKVISEHEYLAHPS